VSQGENVKLYAISVDAPDVSKEFAKKIAADGKGEISFPILSDPDHKIIDAYGLRDPAYQGQSTYGIRTQRFTLLIRQARSPGPGSNRIIETVRLTRTFALHLMP
jgi:alkyl hydroperoxide reductase subunit AhpC